MMHYFFQRMDQDPIFAEFFIWIGGLVLLFLFIQLVIYLERWTYSSPTVYTPEQLASENMRSVSAGLPDGRWVQARPSGYGGFRLLYRLKLAYMVFVGKWDALKWEGQ